MRKLMLLVLVAALSGVAFAGTDPVFSGTFSTYWGFDLDAAKGSQIIDKATDAMKIDLNATIDEFNTVSVTVEIADALYWDDIDDDGFIEGKVGTVDTSLPVAGTEVDNRGDYLRMKEFTITSDILGTLGVDSPVGVKIKLGKFAFGAAQVVNVAPVSVKKADGNDGLPSDIGIGLDLMFVNDMITFSTVLYADSFDDKAKAMDVKNAEYNRVEWGATLKATGIAGMIDVAAYFMHSSYDLYIKENPDKDRNDSDGNSFGISLAVAPVDGIKFGLGFEYDLDSVSAKTTRDNTTGKMYEDLAKGVAKAQFDVSFTMIDKLAVGLSLGTSDFSAKYAAGLALKFSAAYDILDNLGVYGAIGFDFQKNAKDIENLMMYDAGVTTALGPIAITVGASKNLNYKAPKDDWDDVIFIKFSTSF